MSLNLMGQGFPMLLGILLMPHILKGLGAERFGLLTLAWTLIGIFTLFDLGFGRAVTHAVSRALAENRQQEVAQIAVTGILSTFLFGFVAGAGLWFAASNVVGRFHVQENLVHEAVWAVRMVAIGIPLVTMMSGVRSFLESMAAWRFINGYRIFVGVGNFVGPFLLLRRTPNVAVIIAFLVLLRLVSLIHHLYWARRLWPSLNYIHGWELTEFSRLLKYGGWMMLSNLISPLMVYMDRFFIGAWVGLQAVTYYATPVDVLTRVLIIPNSLVAALFPLVTEMLHREGGEVDRTFRKSVSMMGVLMIPLGLGCVLFAHPLLNVWMGSRFADHAALIFKLITVGVVANSFSAVPFSLIQAAGRPDLTAKLHLLELPVYAVLLVFCVKHWGLEGAAAAWSLRLILDSVMLFVIWNQIIKRRNACLFSAISS